jgi:hypothetical protein
VDSMQVNTSVWQSCGQCKLVRTHARMPCEWDWMQDGQYRDSQPLPHAS